MASGTAQKELIVGTSSFDLVDKDARFARYDGRKSSKWNIGQPWESQVVQLFEATSNIDLLERANRLHTTIGELESSGFSREQILRHILSEEPDLNYYNLLLRRAEWGNRLVCALYRERYWKGADDLLWDDFVMGRIHRALGGEMKRTKRFDGKLFYDIDREKDYLHFSSVNHRQQTCPVFEITANKLPQRRPSGHTTDLRLDINFVNVSRIEVCERGGEVTFFKTFKGEEVLLTYRQKPIGSTYEIKIDSLSPNSD